MGNDFIFSNGFGFFPNAPSGGMHSTWPLDGITEKIGFSFVCPPGGRTLSKVIFRISAQSGSPTTAAGDIKCEIYDTTAAGLPNAVISGGTTTTFTPDPTGAAWIEFTGLTASLTAGAIYWVVLSCPNSGKYVTPTFGDTATGNIYDNISAYSSGMVARFYNGSDWTTVTNRVGVCLPRLEFSSPQEFMGVPASLINATTAGTQIYGTRAQGGYATSPAYGLLRARGIAAFLRKTGSPTYDITAKLSVNSGTPTDSVTVSASLVTTGTWQNFFFSSVVEIPNSTTFRMFLRASTGGDSSNYIRIYSYSIHDSDAVRALLPFGGIAECFTADVTATPIVWDTSADTDEVPTIGLLLDGGQPFGTPSGGGGMIVHPGMSGGMRG